MISGKDVRIENGYIIINGEKHPIVQDVSELEGEIEELDTAIAGRAEFFKSTTNTVTQTINIGVIEENRTYVFACGFNTNYVLELIAISANGANVAHKPIANSEINSISALSYDASTGTMIITVANNPFGYGRMTRLS